MKAIFLTIWITFLCGLIPTNGWTAPTIFSAPQSISHGQSIVISGSEFGTKSPAKPFLWAPFEGSLNPSNLGIKTAWSGNENMTYAAGEGINGTGASKGIVNSPPWTLAIDSNGFYWNGLSQKTYVYRKTKENFSTAGYNWKILRAWRAIGQLPDFYIHPNMASGAEGVSPQTSNWFQDASTARGSANVWRTEEFIQQANSATSLSDGIVQWITNGLLTFYVPYSGHTWKINDGSGLMSLLLPVHGVIANATVPSGGTHWADDVYVDNTWARVMIGDQPTFAASTHREIQIPQTWSNDGTSIGIIVNQGTFANGNSAYLFVIDANGNVSAGKQITFVNSTGAPNTVNSLIKTTTSPYP
jgi:hypothetical protein